LSFSFSFAFEFEFAWELDLALELTIAAAVKTVDVIACCIMSAAEFGVDDDALAFQAE